MLKLITTLLIAIGFAGAVSASAQEYDLQYQGIYYQYNYPEKTALTVVGEWYPYPYSGDVVIPATVPTPYGELPVKRIGIHAFSGCPITSISLPEGLTGLAGECFYGCNNLESIVVPESVEVIGPGAFSNCANLRSVTLPTVLSDEDALGMALGGMAFYNDPRLETVRMPSTGLTSIHMFLFSKCPSLKSITIPEGVETIYYQAFAESGLTEVTIPSSVTKTDPEVFRDCPDLRKVTFSDSDIPLLFLTKYAGDDKMYFYHTDVEEMYCGREINIENEEAYYSIVSPFMNMSSLRTLTIGDKVKKIKRKQFFDLLKLEKLTIGASVSEIGDLAFEFFSPTGVEPDGIAEVISRAAVPPAVASKDAFSPKTYNGTLIVPEGSEADYRGAEVWKLFYTEGGISDIVADSDAAGPCDIYNMQGICVRRGASAQEAATLPPGIYIINGQKVIK